MHSVVVALSLKRNKNKEINKIRNITNKVRAYDATSLESSQIKTKKLVFTASVPHVQH